MSGSDEVQEGGCRCGQVRFRIGGAPLVTMACHCTGCQRMTASAFSLSALYSSDGFEVTSGEPVLGGLRGNPHHFFCPNCMSWVFTRFVDMAGFVNVRATLLDDARAYRPFIETYTSERLPWARTPAVHSFEQFPPEEEFPALVSAYAAQRE